jgi:hypothetical protein
MVDGEIVGDELLEAFRPEDTLVDRSFQTDSRAKPASPEVGIASDALEVQR